MGDQSRMTLRFFPRLWRRGVLLACLLLSAPVWSADILLTAAEDGAGVQAFAQALAQRRPDDHVTFTPLKDLPAPSQLPASTRLILLDHHDAPAAGHPGRAKTLELLGRTYYWKTMRSYVEKYVGNCHIPDFSPFHSLICRHISHTQQHTQNVTHPQDRTRHRFPLGRPQCRALASISLQANPTPQCDPHRKNTTSASTASEFTTRSSSAKCSSPD